MTKRAVEEIKKDIEIYETEYRKLRQERYRKNKSFMVDELNVLSQRIKSLKLELNKAKFRDFGKRARRKEM